MFLKHIVDRFWSNVQKTDDHWIWLGKLDEDGYGRLWDGESATRPHIFAYKLLVGRIPFGKDVHHKCKNRSCVRPDHLELAKHGKHPNEGLRCNTHCINGHEFTKQNTKLQFKSGYCVRICVTCSRETSRKWADEKRRLLGIPMRTIKVRRTK